MPALPARVFLFGGDPSVFFEIFSVRKNSKRFNRLTLRNRTFSPVTWPVISPVILRVFA
jgi:hypothetical protein